MRLIDYYNYIAMAAYILMGGAALYFYFSGKKKAGIHLSDKALRISFVVVMLVAAALRLYKLGTVPYGLQQDEASIGYEAYILSNFGIDRDGYHFPVYPITWGCGGGSPLLIYLNVISIALFGPGILKLRLIPAVCGILTVFLFYKTLRLGFEEKSYRNEASLLGAAFLAISPWHVILSRWSLDSNIMPFNLILSVYLYLLASKKKSSVIYCLSAASFALCMYSYGAATIVVPVTLFLIAIYSVKNKSLTIPQLAYSVVTFLVVFAPLLLFYAVNYLGVPEIITDVVTFNRFTAKRTGEAFVSLGGGFFKGILGNLKALLLTISVGNEKNTIAHYLPGYATLFEFTFPVTFLGFVIGVKELFSKDDDKGRQGGILNAMFIFVTLGNVLLDMVILPDIQRLVMLFIPLIYFFVRGAVFVFENLGRTAAIALTMILLLGGVSFTRDYFTQYNRWTISIFMPGYGDAIKRAYEIAGDDRTIRSTYDGLAAPFMIALYYNNYDPNRFTSTVMYKDETAEFRIAESFGNFIFELPQDVNSKEYEGDVFVVSSADRDRFTDISMFTEEDFGGYHVLYK
ncbi:MAG: glycosyltransferase family 39 protein [Butyrivibrio sp.]|nr:glycosyltransferase family 39 protein [Butyrivibrio sp.]